MDKDKTQGQLLNEKLTYKQPHIADAARNQIPNSEEFSKGYKRFLDQSKTERACVLTTEKMLVSYGYVLFDEKKEYKPGDKVYTINRGKAIMAATIGTEQLDQGMRINAAHIDSPRLDLKPNPLYEKNEISLMKTHYYGGIRKYQWGAMPLSMHGVISKKNGEIVTICIGEEEGDPVFCITDLLPHLAAEQNKRSLAEGLKGEELNIIIGSIPFEDIEVKDRVKLAVLKLLNDKYGIIERDFVRAEIEMVPAHKAADVGLDKSIVGAYGQDDRVCAYTALMAELETKSPKYTTLLVLADKEEVGSTGNTGLDSRFMVHFIEYLSEMQNVNSKTVLRNSKCLSADVNAAFDPTFPKVMDANNSCYMNKGCVITKYTGARGKSSTSDASAEFVGFVADLLDEAGVYWQTGELGAVDVGGGGTVARFIASYNIDVIDIGVPILSMHSPFELASKLDIYNTYLAFKAFSK